VVGARGLALGFIRPVVALALDLPFTVVAGDELLLTRGDAATALERTGVAAADGGKGLPPVGDLANFGCVAGETGVTFCD